MNSLQRIQAAVRFEKTDKVPVVAQVFGHAATLANVRLDEYVRDGGLLARCQLDALDRYGYDAVFSVMDVSVETEAAGSLLRYAQNRYPVVERYALEDDFDLDGLRTPNPHEAGRMPEMLKAIRLLRQQLTDEILVVGCVTGPFTLTTQLLGMERALYLAVDDPTRLELVMDFATDVIIRFGAAQIEAGAHTPIVFNPSASPAVIPPAFFREFELPRLTRVFSAFAQAGSIANWLHIAGPVGGILPFYPAAGVQIANFDYCVSAEEVVSALPATCVDGNIRPLAFVDASASAIAADAAGLIAEFRDRGGFILSSGCEIPPESSAPNVSALVSAADAAR
jgi:uroporphyrinogen decarboxylase